MNITCFMMVLITFVYHYCIINMYKKHIEKLKCCGNCCYYDCSMSRCCNLLSDNVNSTVDADYKCDNWKLNEFLRKD